MDPEAIADLLILTGLLIYACVLLSAIPAILRYRASWSVRNRHRIRVMSIAERTRDLPVMFHAGPRTTEEERIYLRLLKWHPLRMTAAVIAFLMFIAADQIDLAAEYLRKLTEILGF